MGCVANDRRKTVTTKRQEMEQRRMRAIELFAAGPQTEPGGENARRYPHVSQPLAQSHKI